MTKRKRRNYSAAFKAKVAISMDGRGRRLDNVFIEWLWRGVKYEDIYLRADESPAALGRRTPDAVYFDAGVKAAA